MTRRFTALITYLNTNTDNKVVTDIPGGKCDPSRMRHSTDIGAPTRLLGG
ncbi:hypothetical protein [Archangium sp.]